MNSSGSLPGKTLSLCQPGTYGLQARLQISCIARRRRSSCHRRLALTILILECFNYSELLRLSLFLNKELLERFYRRSDLLPIDHSIYCGCLSQRY